MKVVYLDDQPNSDDVHVVRQAVNLLGDELRDEAEAIAEIVFNVIGPTASGEQGLFLEGDGTASELEDSATGIPSKHDVDTLVTDPNTLYLIDVNWGSDWRRDYGLRLAKYLSTRGVKRDQIHLFTLWGQAVRESEVLEQHRMRDGALPWYNCFDKAAYSGPEGPPRLASQLYRSAIRTLSLPTADEHPGSAPEWEFEGLIGCSPQMRSLYRVIDRYSRRRNPTILVTGENGTGKELVTAAIHYRSARSKEPFVVVNCAAISRDLMESEFFGHEKGAFTGAVGRKAGKFEQADGGTLFLDEIGELNLDLQAKLLRALQSREVVRVGGSETISFDCRVISATNKDLVAMIRAGQFREDLYHRISALDLRLPPLRERGGDIMLLARQFLLKLRAEEDMGPVGFSPRARIALMAYGWPGNVRELENVVMKAFYNSQERCHGEILDKSRVIDLDDLPSNLSPSNGSGTTGAESLRDAIHIVLKLNKRNYSSTARQLGVDQRFVKLSLEEHGSPEVIFSPSGQPDFLLPQTADAAGLNFTQWAQVEPWFIERFRRHAFLGGRFRIAPNRVCLRHLIEAALPESLENSKEMQPNLMTLRLLVRAIKKHGLLLINRKHATLTEKRFWSLIFRLIIHNTHNGRQIMESAFDLPDILLDPSKDRFDSFVGELKANMGLISTMISRLIEEEFSEASKL